MTDALIYVITLLIFINFFGVLLYLPVSICFNLIHILIYFIYLYFNYILIYLYFMFKLFICFLSNYKLRHVLNIK